MTQETQHEQHHATPEELNSISKLWLLPIVAIFIGAWLIYYQISNQGQEITIYFSSAEGLEPGKTKIKTRHVDVGTVTAIQLRKNGPGVRVTARVNKDEEHLLRADSNLWIVTPRISLSGVSGLSTILSGPFIELAPGMSGEVRYSFEGLETPPLTPAGTPGLHVTLNSDDEFAYKKGDPIIYKGIRVGKLEDIYFNLEERIVYYNAFIEAPYHELITTNTRFWDASGVRLELGAEGLMVHTGSVETLLTNGVTFGIPQGLPRGEIIQERAYFDIHASQAEANARRFKYKAKFTLLIEDSVRGLKPGAPVEYRGIPIGEVETINPLQNQTFSLLEEGYKIPIVIAIYPGMVASNDTEEGVKRVNDQVALWVKNGLRATLETGNLITGGQYVDLQNYKDLEPAKLQQNLGHPTIPTISNEFAQLTQKVSSILKKINELPFSQLGANLNVSIEELAATAAEFKQSAEGINKLLSEAEQQNLIKQLNRSLRAFELLANTYGSQSATNGSINEVLLDIQATMLELKPILQRVNETPSSLVIPLEQPQPDVIPKVKRN
ncbi:intermembrane transport protein PqiB [Planctobacterium marinum]|uniref:Paraquat-inducible protein B n=1 Tax=Planctobacterium marinum TaxID=1631968 RepID=A0AA48HGF7_9ALTE|nr:paraquat-inducible protein B [Planctobacterium marinum]